MTMKAKPTYEELERRVRELEKIECEHKHLRKVLKENERLFKWPYEKAPLGYQILDENGNFQQTHCIFHDITDRKQAEEKLRHRLLYEQMLSRISTMAVQHENLERFLNDSLTIMGETLHISRTYLFEYHHETDSMDNTVEWCAPGESPQKDNLQGVPAAATPWWMVTLKEEGTINFSDIENIPDEGTKEILRPQGIRSILVVPLFVAGRFYGFMGFDECRFHREWPEEDVELLLAISRIIAGALYKKQSEEEIRRERQQLLSIFNSIEESIYISDPETYEILYVNPKLANILQRDCVGGVCHKEFQGLDEPCSFCTNDIILKRKPQPHYWEYYNPKLQQHFSIVNRIIEWPDGRNVRFEMATDITDRRMTEEALREKTHFLQNIIDTTSDFISVTDLEGNFKFIGPSHSILGYDPDTLVGRNVMELVHPDDYQEIATAFADFLANREDGRKVEYRYRRADGDYLWFETVGKFILDDAGNPKEILFTSRDFTARKRAEGELKRIEWMLSIKPILNIKAQTETHDQGYGDLTELNRDGIILKSIGREPLKSFANDYLELLGTSSAIYEVNGDYALGIFASGWCRMMDRASRKLCHTPDNVEALNSGRWLCHESCWTDCSKEAIAKGVQVDIECNGGIRLYAVPIFAGGNIIGAINFGYGNPPKDPEKIKMLADVYHLNYDDLLSEATAYDSRPPYIIEMAKKRLNSTAKLIGSMVETKQTMEALRDSEEKHRRLFETMAQGVIYQAADGVIISANPAAERILGLSLEQMRGKTSMDPCWRMIKEDSTEVSGTDHPTRTALRTGETIGPVIRGVFNPDKKAYVWLSITAIPLFQPGETKPFQAYATFEDVTERKQAIEALKEREAFIKATLDNLPVGVSVNTVDPKVHFTYMNENFATFYRTTREALAAPNDFWEIVYTDATFREEIKKRVLEDCASNDPERMYWEDIPISRPGKKPFYITAKNIPLPERNLMVSIVWDVTERKRAEDEREKLRDQLSQSQKMESVGRLAGGVAHDINNKMLVISGYAELVQETLKESDPIYGFVGEIIDACKKSTDIVNQLLAFARKQTIRPKVCDLNEIVEGMLKMLRRLIGEDIDFLWLPETRLWPIKIDPAQIDQILANLCVNARDAITGVGKITIETENVTINEEYCSRNAGFLPGEYVMLAISDSGVGMDKETISSIFEPFFTTKPVGLGTGLGLATVYGIVKQNNGFINVYSEPGEGTIFKIYLPHHPVKDREIQTESTGEVFKGHGETILLVEDEQGILMITRLILEKFGYVVLCAATPAEAIRLAEEHSKTIDLFITDVIMPEMNGRDLADQINKLYPNIKTLFMSGYTANVIAHHGVLDKGVHFIQKPFSKKELAVKIRKVLEQS